MKRIVFFLLICIPAFSFSQDSVNVSKPNQFIQPETAIRLRCRSSILDSASQPLMLINNQRYDLKEIKQLNPNNIEKVEILKGASAISLYGKEAINGVILITLKCSAPAKDERLFGLIL